jgi:hypothetical protein
MVKGTLMKTIDDKVMKNRGYGKLVEGNPWKTHGMIKVVSIRIYLLPSLVIDEVYVVTK